MKHFIQSLRCAFQGVLYAFSTEKNIRVHLLIFMLALITAFYFDISKVEFLIILLISAVTFSLELINTAIERLADKVSPEFDIQIGIVKDVMAGAVLVSSIFSLIIGGVIFFNPLLKLIQS